MNKRKFYAACVSVLFALFIMACNGTANTGGNTKIFAYELRGTWVSNDPSVYKGTLKIDTDRITITDYSENQTPSGQDDNRRPFKNFTKNIALKGYSDGGKIFIEDYGMLQEGIPYTYWEENPSPYNKKTKFINFTFGGRDEKLQM